jgi:osmotically-inducible protein OsmY
MRKEATRAGEILLAGLAGAALMYVLDPARGRRRRALMRDQAIHAGHELRGLGDAAESRARDLRNRARGVVVEARHRFRREEVDDDILVLRVCSGLGHVLANPGAVEVTAEHGCVTLTGPALADEVDRLLAAVEAVPGVRDVVSRLDVHAEPGSVPGLQGHPDPGDMY